MIDFIGIAATVCGKTALTKLLGFMKGNKSQLQLAYEKAFENTVYWYENEFGNEYGTKTNRFFEQTITEQELAKLTLLRPKPDISLISGIKLPEGDATPPKVVKAFVEKLRNEMVKIRECEAVLVEREKLLTVMEVKSDTHDIRNSLNRLVELKETELELKHSNQNQLHQDPDPIDGNELERIFRDEYHLDLLDYGHLGTASARDAMKHKLELEKVYVALNVKDRIFDRLTSAAKSGELSALQRKNLPLLFQRFDELLHLKQEKDQRIFHDEKEIDDSLLYKAAAKILRESDAVNLRDPRVIIDEIQGRQRIEKNELYRILWFLSSSMIIPRPLAEIPGMNQAFLIIGDAGGGKSTACRYMTIGCFDEMKSVYSGKHDQESGKCEKTADRLESSRDYRYVVRSGVLRP